MKLAVATVLLSTFVIAQGYIKTVKIENAEDLDKNPEAKGIFCGSVKQCDVVPDYAKSSVILNLQSQIEKLEKENNKLQGDIKALGDKAEAAKEQLRLDDFKQIKDLKPVFWLSGTYFDGFKAGNLSRTGIAPSKDVLGNAVTTVGSVPVTTYRNKMAYIFDKTNSIMSSASVSTKFTFAVVYRLPNPLSGDEGRFFTSNVGNKLFAGWYGRTYELYIEGWINEQNLRTCDTVILMVTNDNGVKNLWTEDRQLVVNSRVGANDWGQVVIGRPQIYANEAAAVNVYEALVFNKVLNDDERSNLMSVLKRWYA